MVRTFRALRWTCAGLACAFVLGAGAKEEGASDFDRGYKDELEKGVVVKDLQRKDKPKNDKEANARAVSYHVKNLSDKDPAIRENSAEMLGLIQSPDAVPYLIEALQDKHLMVQLKAHAALIKITGKNFDYRDYPAWKNWWLTNSKEFLQQKESGPSDVAKVRAMHSNTLGLNALSAGEFALAINYFRDAVNQDPEIPDYKNNLGLAVMETGAFIDAMHYFQETIGLNDALPQPYMNIGTCYARMGRQIEAQHWFRKALTVDKDGKLWEPFWTLGKEYLKNGENYMAMELLEQARAKAQGNNHFDPRIYRDLALAHYALDQYYSAWTEIKNVEALGFELDKGFVQKVRDALKAQGVDPDKDPLKATTQPAGTESEAPRAPSPATEPMTGRADKGAPSPQSP
ncbi:MAG: HEAT repeat domain-containing protein [Planctomycetes bacterium]|nr:HEAT repeat domain-containing protein [Planctomycetota bacterium]